MKLSVLKSIISVFLIASLFTVSLTSCKNAEEDKSTDLSSSVPSNNTVSSEVDNTSKEEPEINPDLPNPPKEKEYSALRGDVTLPIDMDTFKQLKVNIATPDRYTAWPMLGISNDKLVCVYTVADQHNSTEAKLYMKSSSSNGFAWTAPKEVFTEKTGVKGITGTGNDSKGNMLLWYRDRNPDTWATTHELYRLDGTEMTQISTPDFSFPGGAHIGNIFTVEDNLFCFYNTYGNTRSWGLLKSTDDGLTWEQIPIEENLPKAECPVEIEGVYQGEGKILLLGRKDANEGTIAMFQMQSSDYGKTWSREYTNITDALGSSPSMIFDAKTNKITLYFFARTTGQLKRRVVSINDVWNNPQNWSNSEILESESARGQDTGNVKTVSINGLHIATYYAGNSSTTGIYGVIIKD